MPFVKFGDGTINTEGLVAVFFYSDKVYPVHVTGYTDPFPCQRNEFECISDWIHHRLFENECIQDCQFVVIREYISSILLSKDKKTITFNYRGCNKPLFSTMHFDSIEMAEQRYLEIITKLPMGR